MRQLFILVLFIIYSTGIYATQDGALSLNHFLIQFNGTGGSGLVEIRGDQNSEGKIAAIAVSVFGQHFEFPKEVLAQLPTDAIENIQFSYDAGRTAFSGKTLIMEFQSARDARTQQRLLISVNENGHLQVLHD